jgi:Predicted AAA-ATPase/PD-(D/E)XK nuclease superfamily
MMIKITYGQSDFKALIDNGFFYQDRTKFIETLENWKSNFPVFLRPRRFGKSLFVMMLHYYYGLEHKEAFSTIFKNLYIGQHPTAEANKYMVLSFDFSGIDTTTHKSTYQGFLTNTINGVRTFIGAYKSFFTDEDKQIILGQLSPEAVVQTLFGILKTKDAPNKIYLLIDEYDHFANELLSFDFKRFKSNVSQNGFVRKFYESLKKAARDGIIGRIFITGVSPITMDSMTSGFNISDNISLNPIFHNMMGFTHAEVKTLLEGIGIPSEKIPTMMSDLAEWYDGYQFAEGEKPLFNPDMILYFLKEYSIKGEYPTEMLDSNIITDYQKIRNIFNIGEGETDRFSLLNELVEVGYIDFPLTRIYNLVHRFNEDDFLSLLFYMGLLTFKEAGSSDWRFQIPNYVIKKLYFEYFGALYLEKTRFSKSLRPISRAIDALMNDGRPTPFLEIVEHVLQENHSNRDEMVYGEKHLQTLIIALLFPYKAFKIHSEYESKRTYPDIFLERIPDRKINFEVVLELKYVKKSALDKDPDTLNNVIAEAQTQLNGYMATERFSRPDVRGFYIVFFGGKVHECKEYGHY